MMILTVSPWNSFSWQFSIACFHLRCVCVSVCAHRYMYVCTYMSVCVDVYECMLQALFVHGMAVKTKQGFFQLVLSKQIFQVFTHAWLVGGSHVVRKPWAYDSFLCHTVVFSHSPIMHIQQLFTLPLPLLTSSLSPSPSLPPSLSFLLTVQVQLHFQHQMCTFLFLWERKRTTSIPHIRKCTTLLHIQSL